MDKMILKFTWKRKGNMDETNSEKKVVEDSHYLIFQTYMTTIIKSLYCWPKTRQITTAEWNGALWSTSHWYLTMMKNIAKGSLRGNWYLSIWTKKSTIIHPNLSFKPFSKLFRFSSIQKVSLIWRYMPVTSTLHNLSQRNRIRGQIELQSGALIQIYLSIYSTKKNQGQK